MVRIWPSFDADADENADRTSLPTESTSATNAVGPMGRFTRLAAAPAESDESAISEEIFKLPQWRLVASWTVNIDLNAAEFSFSPPTEVEFKPGVEYQWHTRMYGARAFVRLYEYTGLGPIE